MTMAERINEAIKASGKTQADIARACKVSDSAVTQWIKGPVKGLKAETALALADATGYRMQWILNGRGPKLRADRDRVAGAPESQPSSQTFSVDAERLATLLDEIEDEGARRRARYAAQSVILRLLQGLPLQPTAAPGEDSIPETPPAQSLPPASGDQQTPARTHTGPGEPPGPQASERKRKE
jgi:transcriptional regulator with XRE-family HTH domain